MPILIGIEKFESKLNDLALTVRRKALVKATKSGAELIRAEAAERAPRDTGRLAENVVTLLRTSENSADEVTVRIGPAKSTFYGLFAEIGTAHATAEPFLGPAFDAKKDEALKIASDEFRNAVEEVARKG